MTSNDPDYVTLITPNHSEMRVCRNGRVDWVLASGGVTDSRIRIPSGDEIRNPSGVADALRTLAGFIDGTGTPAH